MFAPDSLYLSYARLDSSSMKYYNCILRYTKLSVIDNELKTSTDPFKTCFEFPYISNLENAVLAGGMDYNGGLRGIMYQNTYEFPTITVGAREITFLGECTTDTLMAFTFSSPLFRNGKSLILKAMSPTTSVIAFKVGSQQTNLNSILLIKVVFNPDPTVCTVVSMLEPIKALILNPIPNGNECAFYGFCEVNSIHPMVLAGTLNLLLGGKTLKFDS